jgi:hypothetical protein
MRRKTLMANDIVGSEAFALFAHVEWAEQELFQVSNLPNPPNAQTMTE